MAQITKPSLIKPTINGDINTWGHKLNENIDKTSLFMDEVITDSQDKDQELTRLEKDKVSKDEVEEIVEIKVDKYVETNVKPEIDKYLEQTTKPNLDNYLEQKKADLDKYNIEVKKPELDAYTNEKKKELDAHEKIKETELDSHTTKKEEQLDTYTITKKEEITTHTTQKIEEVNTHVEAKKTEITQHADNEKEKITQHTTAKIEEIDTHVVTKKTELDTYEKEKEKQLDAYTTTKEGELDTHTVKKQEQLDAYEKTKETELGQYAESERTSITNHTTSKIEEITQHTDSEKIRVTTHTDAEIERIKGEGTTQVGLVTAEGTKQVNLVTKEGEKQVQAVIEAGEGLAIKVDDLEKNKLDKGEVSENYNTAKKIEDVIKGNKQLIDNLGTGKLDKGTYTGTAQDLKDSIDNVVNLTEKTIAGKGLTQTKEGINNTINVISADEGIIVNDDNIKLNVVDDLTTGGVKRPLSAEQGKVLKQLIDNLGTGGATQLLRNQRALGDFDYIGQLQASGKSISVGNRLYKPILYLDGIRMDKNTYTVDLTNGIITLNEVYADYEVTWVVEDDYPYYIRFSFPTLNLLINDNGIKSIIKLGDVIEIQGESNSGDGGHRLVKCENTSKLNGVSIGEGKYLNEIPNTRISDKLNRGSYNGTADDLKKLIDGKENSITKNTGFNLNKSDEINSDNTNTLATSKAVKTLNDKKFDKGNLPSIIPDAKSLYDALDNHGGVPLDTDLPYLNDAGTKRVGKVYFDRNKKGLFKCIKETTSQDNIAEFFTDISNESNSGRLANLICVSEKNYGDFGNYVNIPYPQGYTTENSNVIIMDYDKYNYGTTVYSLSPDKKQFKGTRLSGSIAESNSPLFFFIKN